MGSDTQVNQCGSSRRNFEVKSDVALAAKPPVRHPRLFEHEGLFEEVLHMPCDQPRGPVSLDRGNANSNRCLHGG